MDFDADVPPGFMTPTDASKKERAMAVTGGPSRRPTAVVFPKICERVAVPHKAAQFPQASVAGMRGAEGNNPSEEEEGGSLGWKAMAGWGSRGVHRCRGDGVTVVEAGRGKA